ISEEDVQRWMDEFANEITAVLDSVGRRLDALPGAFPSANLNQLAAIVRNAANFRARGGDLELLYRRRLVKTRLHGDYHLGQLLRTSAEDANEWVVLDFEGEPGRSLAERRQKHSPLRDVAGMLRSFDYARQQSMAEHRTVDFRTQTALRRWSEAWMTEVREGFLAEYRAATEGAPFIPPDSEHLRRMLRVFELEKAIYELAYEMNNRPDWIWIPVVGITELTGSGI